MCKNIFIHYADRANFKIVSIDIKFTKTLPFTLKTRKKRSHFKALDSGIPTNTFWVTVVA